MDNDKETEARPSHSEEVIICILETKRAIMALSIDKDWYIPSLLHIY